MAYNRTFNPDALPAFAEPERKHANDYPPPTTAAAPAPRPLGAPSHSPPINAQYNKPPPPLPSQQHSNNHSGRHPAHGSSAGPDPGLRHDSYGAGAGAGRGVGRHPSPVSQPQGNYAGAYANSPPPNHNGRFPPPSNANNQRPVQTSRPPPSPAPGGSATDPTLLPLFRAVDKNGSGQLSEKELGAALVNGDWSSFDPYTVRLMIRMFDSDRSGTIGFEEFCGLWSFLASWRTLFDRFDVDRSGNISLDEFTSALTAFGYRLGDGFIRFLFGVYDKEHKGSLSFDLFVQSCISLKRMTDVFKRYDDDRDGFITLSFEDFLTEILRQR